MKCNVVFNVTVSIVDLGFHPFTEPTQTLNVLIGRIVRGHLCNARLQQEADIDQIKCQLVFILDGTQAQRVGQALGRCHYVSTRPAPHFHAALAGQQFDRFPDGAAAHAKLFAQFKLIWQLCPRLDGGIQNIVVDLIFDLLRQKLVF